MKVARTSKIDPQARVQLGREVLDMVGASVGDFAKVIVDEERRCILLVPLDASLPAPHAYDQSPGPLPLHRAAQTASQEEGGMQE
jgi:hypothetical protein